MGGDEGVITQSQPLNMPASKNCVRLYAAYKHPCTKTPRHVHVIDLRIIILVGNVMIIVRLPTLVYLHECIMQLTS